MATADDTSKAGLWITDNLDFTDRSRDVKDEYEMGKQLGEPGAFGVAYLAKRKRDGQGFAVKQISKAKWATSKKPQRYIKALLNEINILKYAEHDNLVNLEDVFEDKVNLYLVMELCTGGELFDKISQEDHLSEKTTMRILKDVLEGLEYLHSNKIAHCDLKPDNFLFKDKGRKSKLMIIDFGMAKLVPRGKFLQEMCGTPYYVAPEVLDREYSTAADMWSIGVVMFVMLFGYPPFYVDAQRAGADEAKQIYKLIRSGFNPKIKGGYGPWFPKDIPVSPAARDLIARLLDTNVVNRLTASEALAHPWFASKKTSNSPLNRLVLDGIKSFQNANKIKQLVVNVFASQAENFLNTTQHDAIKNTFKRLDLNGDGGLSYDEFTAGFADELGQRLVTKAKFAALDLDGDCKINYEELCGAILDKCVLARDERLFEAFFVMDKNEDGKLSPEELSQVLKECHIDITPEELREQHSAADLDGDGFISWQEFLQNMDSGTNKSIMWGKLKETEDRMKKKKKRR